MLLLWLRPEAFAAATGCPLRPQEPKWHRCNTPKQLKFVEGERGALRYVKGHDELNHDYLTWTFGNSVNFL